MSITKLLYFDDNYQTEFSSTVTDVNKENATVVLESTLFYPRGGNQDSDTGYLKYKQHQISVVRTSKDKVTGEVIHHISKDDVEKLSLIEPQSLIHGKVDWERRYALMKVHTAQHLLSSLFTEMFKADTVDVEITKTHGEILLNKELLLSEVLDVQARVNYLISKGNVSTNRVLVDDRYHLEIGDIDDRECGGTHVARLIEISKIFIFNYEKSKIFYAVDTIADEKAYTLQIDALSISRLFPKEIKNAWDFEVYLNKLQTDYVNLRQTAISISLEFLSLKLCSKGENINGYRVIFCQTGELSTKEVKSAIDGLKLEDEKLIVVLCKNDSLVISNSTSLDANEILTIIKQKDNQVKGGGSKRFAQGGPWKGSFVELQVLISEYIKAT